MSNGVKASPVQELVGPRIGDRVKATMNGKDWFSGVLVEEVELFTQYGVKLDETGEVRFFIEAVPNAGIQPSERSEDRLE